MARSRNIKPSLLKNEILGEADPLLTILFAGLWMLADREGRLEDRPKRIKAEVFPYRELPDFNGYLTELAQLGFIDRYEVGGIAVIQVLEFAKHQSPHKTEKASELPEKPVKTGSCPVTVKAPLNDDNLTEPAALIPDSFNLIPLKGFTADGSLDKPLIWNLWEARAGSKARSLLGKLVRDFGEDAALEAVLMVEAAEPADPIAYIAGIFKQTPSKSQVVDYLVAKQVPADLATKYFNSRESVSWKRGGQRIVNWIPDAENYLNSCMVGAQ